MPPPCNINGAHVVQVMPGSPATKLRTEATRGAVAHIKGQGAAAAMLLHFASLHSLALTTAPFSGVSVLITGWIAGSFRDSTSAGCWTFEYLAEVGATGPSQAVHTGGACGCAVSAADVARRPAAGRQQFVGDWYHYRILLEYVAIRVNDVKVP